MNILCLNTAFSEAQIALSHNGKTYFKSIDANSKHSENLLVEIEKLFATAGAKNTSKFLDEIDAIAVVVGPGSFTGLRISIATAKAILSTKTNMKAISIGSLELIARESKSENKTAILDALSGLYFVSSFEGNREIEAPKMIKGEEITGKNNLVSVEKLPFETEIVSLSISSLLSLAEEKARNNNFISEPELVPLYIRPSQAEANLNANSK